MHQMNMAMAYKKTMSEVAKEAAPQQAEEEPPSTAQEVGRPARRSTKRLPTAEDQERTADVIDDPAGPGLPIAPIADDLEWEHEQPGDKREARNCSD
jgi:hypothetical protein